MEATPPPQSNHGCGCLPLPNRLTRRSAFLGCRAPASGQPRWRRRRPGRAELAGGSSTPTKTPSWRRSMAYTSSQRLPCSRVVKSPSPTSSADRTAHSATGFRRRWRVSGLERRSRKARLGGAFRSAEPDGEPANCITFPGACRGLVRRAGRPYYRKWLAPASRRCLFVRIAAMSFLRSPLRPSTTFA